MTVACTFGYAEELYDKIGCRDFINYIILINQVSVCHPKGEY